MASVHADAWQHPAKDDCAALYPGGLGDVHNVHIRIHSGKLYEKTPRSILGMNMY